MQLDVEGLITLDEVSLTRIAVINGVGICLTSLRLAKLVS